MLTCLVCFKQTQVILSGFHHTLRIDITLKFDLDFLAGITSFCYALFDSHGPLSAALAAGFGAAAAIRFTCRVKARVNRSRPGVLSIIHDLFCGVLLFKAAVVALNEAKVPTVEIFGGLLLRSQMQP